MWKPSWRPLAELAAELDDEAGRLAGLTLEGEDASVSAVLGPSYRLLQPDAARLYRLLGWLPIGVFDAGVAAVAAGIDTRSAKRLLAVLAKASLAEAVGDGRYRMHDLVRLHARERAAEEEPETEHSWAKTTVTRLSPRRSGGSVSSTRTVEVTVRAATTRVRSPWKVLQRWASRPTGTRSGRPPNNSAASDEPASQPVSGSRLAAMVLVAHSSWSAIFSGSFVAVDGRANSYTVTNHACTVPSWPARR